MRESLCVCLCVYYVCACVEWALWYARAPAVYLFASWGFVCFMAALAVCAVDAVGSAVSCVGDCCVYVCLSLCRIAGGLTNGIDTFTSPSPASLCFPSPILPFSDASSPLLPRCASHRPLVHCPTPASVHSLTSSLFSPVCCCVVADGWVIFCINSTGCVVGVVWAV